MKLILKGGKKQSICAQKSVHEIQVISPSQQAGACLLCVFCCCCCFVGILVLSFVLSSKHQEARSPRTSNKYTIILPKKSVLFSNTILSLCTRGSFGMGKLWVRNQGHNISMGQVCFLAMNQHQQQGNRLSCVSTPSLAVIIR